MRLSSFQNLIENFYTDKFSVYRYTSMLNADGTLGIELSQTPIYQNEPCRISFASPDSSANPTEENNPQSLQIKLFISKDINILKGDKIVAQRMSDDGIVVATYEGIVNLPNTYVTHKEIVLVQKGDA